jgi:PKD repeat protein
LLTKRSVVLCSLFLCSVLLISAVSAQTTATLTVSGTILAHKPVAGFIGFPTNGTAPLKVNFTDQSQYTPTKWKWEYKEKNDGWVKFSDKQNPSYTFQRGTYDIRLTVTNSIGSDTTTKKDYITVTERQRKPEARFTADPWFGKVPLKVTFKDESLFNPTTYLWKFGDGTTSTLKNPPPHTYTHTGLYKVQLTVSNAVGSDTTYRYIFVMQNWWWGRWDYRENEQKSDYEHLDDHTR